MNPFIKARIYQTVAVAALAKASEQFKTELIISLGRLYRLDWGEVSKEDIEVNNEALKCKDFILAAYETSAGKIWITADNRAGNGYDTITVLLPKEY